MEIQSKFWDLVDKRALVEGTEFDKKQGFRGKDKVVLYRNGSVVRFKTTKQARAGDALELASGTVHFVLIDEPTFERVYIELTRRVSRTGGTIGLTMTPINGPVDYIRKKANAGAIADHHFRAVAANWIPVGSDYPLCNEAGEPMDDAWLDREIQDVGEEEAEIVIHGEWETRSASRSLAAFEEATHTAPKSMEIIGGRSALVQGWPWQSTVRIALMADHGELAAHQVWLVAAFQANPDHNDAYDLAHWRVIGEYCNAPGSSEQDDVDAVDGVLKGLGLSLNDVSIAVGDHNRTGRSKGARLLNDEYTELFARKMRLPAEYPHFHVVNAMKGSDSIGYGVKTLNNAFRRGRAEISKDCPRLTEAVKRWSGKNDDYKHWIDALRYGVTQIESELIGGGLALGG